MPQTRSANKRGNAAPVVEVAKPKKAKKQPKAAPAPADPESDPLETATTIYDFTAKNIQGEEVNLGEKYKGHVCIIVNVASKCGHTKLHYEQLVEMFDKYGEEKGLRILAFPCNQFGSQEPGDAKKICEFVEARNVKFDMFEKISVNGKNAHALWKFLTEQKAGPKGKPIKWNFTKFIVDSEGKVIERHEPSVKPLALVKSLEKLW